MLSGGSCGQENKVAFLYCVRLYTIPTDQSKHAKSPVKLAQVVPNMLPGQSIGSISSGSILLWSRQLPGSVIDHLVDDGGALSCPLLRCHWPVADDVLAQHVLELLAVAPMLGISVLEPEDARGDV